MSIPYGMNYSAVAVGGTFKAVRCEACRHEYVYHLIREGSGDKTSILFLDNDGAKATAEAEAKEELGRLLEKGVELVPCPACGHYQENMRRKARRLHRRWMLYTGGTILVLLGPAAMFATIVNAINKSEPGAASIPWPVFVGVLTAFALLGSALIAAKYLLARKYDPNSAPVEIRLQLGRERATPRDKFERMQMLAEMREPREPKLPRYPSGG